VNKYHAALGLLVLTMLNGCGGGGGGGGGNSTDSNYGGPGTNTVSGTVMFKGAPMAGVTVTAFMTNSNSVFETTTTDANGNYSFKDIPSPAKGGVIPDVQFWPTKTGYAFYPSLSGTAATPLSNYQWNAPPQTWLANTGAAVTRAGYNGQFTNADGGPGMIFDVIDLQSNTGNNITGAGFTAYDGSNPLVSLPITGQTTSYAAGDDGALQKGVAASSTRFADNGDGTITDKLTGLIWLKNAGCLAPAFWANAVTEVNQLASGACGLSDGSSAGQWRMPNLIELESLIDVSASNPALSAANPFANVSNGIYWTSTTYYGGEGGSPNAWAIRLSDGRYMNDGFSNAKATASNAVWAVKGKGGGAVTLQATGAYVPFAANDDGSVRNGPALPWPRMRDNGNGTMTDTVTGLIWLKQANCINATWNGALAQIASLASGQCGLSDSSTAGQWRMPNRNEMQSLADRAQNNMADSFDTTFTGKTGIPTQPAAFSSFVGFQYYWTSSTNAANILEAWTVFSCDYGVYDQPKTNMGYALAVR